MKLGKSAAVVAVILLMAAASAAAQDAAPKSGSAVFDKVVEIVLDRFFDPDRLAAFRTETAAVLAENPDLAAHDAATVGEAVDRILASLAASHTARYTPDDVSYYELADIFRLDRRRDTRHLFSGGEVAYFGIGIAVEEIGGKRFIADVYHGGPAASAGVMAGDEIVAGGDGAAGSVVSPRQNRDSFVLQLRRQAGAEPITITVPVSRLEPTGTLLKAISESVRTFTQGNRTLGYIRLWTHASAEVGAILARELGRGRLADVDGLVLDLRGRWGGAPADAAEMFVGRSATTEAIDRDGSVRYLNFRWNRPVVAIIDEGTRSGMELLAYSLKKNGVSLIGETTAGAVLAGTAFVLPDDSLLILAVSDVLVEGRRLEGVGVAPDVEVPFDIRHAAGRDPQLDAARRVLVEALGPANE